jgi:histidinol-phosphate/aromatic aminotransferase/cobyric acid decarboxylase-like protein
LGTLGAVALGRLYPEYKTPAMLVNLGLQALSMTPTLYSEYQASRTANRLYPEADNKQLAAMYLKHLGNNSLQRMALPGILHGLDAVI